jgi:hypothetical protein
LSWYSAQVRRHPSAFPTASANLAVTATSSGISWVNRK